MINSFYDPKTGRFTGGTFMGPAWLLALNTPVGLKALPGRYDSRTQRVDLDTGEVVEYRPAPDARASKRKARRHIAMLEKRLIRPMRELLIDPDNREARNRLESIEAAISKLRSDL